MKHFKILFIVLSLLYSAGAYAYWWDDDDDWWNGDSNWNFDLPEVDITPDDPYDWGLDDDWWRDAYNYDNDWDDNDDPNDWGDYDYPGGNGNNNNNQGKGSDDGEPVYEPINPVQAAKDLADMAKELAAKLNMKELPVNVIYLKDGEYKGFFNARMLNGQIEVSSSFFYAYGDRRGDMISVLYHEFIHSTQARPLVTDKDGMIVRTETNEKVSYTPAELEAYKEECEFNAGLLNLTQEQRDKLIQECMDFYHSGDDYYYVPSNYYLNEIEAYQGELDGEKKRYYSLTDEHREDTERRKEHFINQYNKALDYENRHGYNADGSKK